MNRKTLAIAIPTILLTLLLLIGCSNPADNKPVAKVGDAVTIPAADATPTDGARIYTTTTDAKLDWIASKVTASHEGGFKKLAGTFTLVGDDITAGQINVTIDTTTIWSDSDNLTKHLKSEDFFATEKFPTSTFTSTKIEKNATDHTITGNLELHGVTKSITFPAQMTMTKTQVTLKAEFSINRMDFDIIYPGKVNDLIREEVVLKLDFKAAT